MIPQEKQEAVTRGLSEAFGVTQFEDILTLKGGMTSALVFRIVVQGTPYLLRIIMRTDSTTERHFACMREAAEAGLAPRVWYTSLDDRISITDFVQAQPFPESEALLRMPTVLRKLHALPPFPAALPQLNTTCTFLLNKGPALDGFFPMIHAANLLPKDVSDELFARYAEMVAAYPHHDPDTVPSHNDFFKPDNILFDGDRVWLIDWEAAFQNDRYAELATVANLLVNNEAEEKAFLHTYFGQPPDDYQQARFFLMQQIAHIFYSLVFLLQGSPGVPVNLSQQAPTYRDFNQRFWSGVVKLEDKPAKATYGRVHLDQLLQSTRLPRFKESLRIVSERPSL
jgi:hypothetical protein